MNSKLAFGASRYIARETLSPVVCTDIVKTRSRYSTVAFGFVDMSGTRPRQLVVVLTSSKERGGRHTCQNGSNNRKGQLAMAGPIVRNSVRSTRTFAGFPAKRS